MQYETHCPFCGNTDSVMDGAPDGLAYWERCNICGATGPAQSSAHLAHSLWMERRAANAREKPQRSAYDRRKQDSVH